MAPTTIGVTAAPWKHQLLRSSASWLTPGVGRVPCAAARFHLSAGRSAKLASTSNSTNEADHLKASRAAFAQRQILDELRAVSSGNGSGSSLADGKTRPKFNATAEAALEASSGGRGGGIPLGMAGLSAGGMGSSGPSVIDKMTGQGKKWKELKGGQKVARVTVQSSRSMLIFGGAALTFVLVYALTTELFAKNSPTVVFSDACKRVQHSSGIAEHLLPPYRFHTSSAFTSASSDFSPLNPPARGRRSRSVASVTFTDEKTGSERMLLRFFVEARQKDHDLTLWDRTRAEVIEAGKWVGRKVTEGSEWVGEQIGILDQGDHTSQVDSMSFALDHSDGKTSPVEPSVVSSGLSKAWNFTFGGLTGLARGSSDALGKLTANKRSPGTWASGEVHAEMGKDENGVFQYKHFFVDIPSSSAVVRERVWIVRKQGEVER
ncbi:hypothetical protein BCV70DRAFT_199903 [Testicularia cyperi]|uniref:Mitochondrial import inner membrane translocase subunit TIM21 n=1 Tax=Testicularia cyperi TaxID=1882483 RepID=A0A317XQR1_9BASI|nr:hypothetical protein BCV70DRAFT_199903 [Testicularia cyperi]